MNSDSAVPSAAMPEVPAPKNVTVPESVTAPESTVPEADLEAGQNVSGQNAAGQAAILVFQMLASQRSAVTYPGAQFVVVVERLAALAQDVLIDLVSDDDRPGHGEPGYLLFQKGKLVHAQWGVTVGELAAQQIRRVAGASSLCLFVLAPAAAALAFAVVSASTVFTMSTRTASANSAEGSARVQPPATGACEAQLSRLVQRRFSGVLAVRSGVVSIWVLVAGVTEAHQELGESGTFPPAMQIGWTECELPRLPWAVALLGRPVQSLARAELAQVQPPQAGPIQPPSRRAAPVHDDVLIWNEFLDVLQSHLGDASGRLFNLMQNKYGTHRGQELRAALAVQVERVAGKAEARHFRGHS